MLLKVACKPFANSRFFFWGGKTTIDITLNKAQLEHFTNYRRTALGYGTLDTINSGVAGVAGVAAGVAAGAAAHSDNVLGLVEHRVLILSKKRVNTLAAVRNDKCTSTNVASFAGHAVADSLGAGFLALIVEKRVSNC